MRVGAEGVANRPARLLDARRRMLPGPQADPVERRLQWLRDGLAASDPGLNRLLGAVELMVAIAVTIAVIYGFMQLTHLLWVKAPARVAIDARQAALVAAQHHGITVLAMLLGGLIAVMTASSVLESTARARAVTVVFLPAPMLATMAVAITLAGHQVAGIALLTVVMGLGTYLRKFAPRFGPRVPLYGTMLFIGYLFGFLSNGRLGEDQLGGVAVILWLAAAVSLLLKNVICSLVVRGRFARTQRSFRARSRGVLNAMVDVFDAAGPQARKRAARILRRRLRQLNDTALVIDAGLGAPYALPLGVSVSDAHNELFEIERVAQNLARISERLSGADLPPRLHAEVRGWLLALSAGRSDVVTRAAGALERHEAAEAIGSEEAALVRRLAIAIGEWVPHFERWPRHRPKAEAELPFESSVTLIFGDLPGSVLVSGTAAAPGEDPRGALLSKLRLDAPAQVAIRIMVAVGSAAAIGSIVSAQRFYFAVIAVFITFMGTHTAGEQVTKGVNRVIGTVGGILVGSLLAHAIGHSTWSVAVIIGAFGVGTYFIKTSYALMVIGVTIMVSQLYEQLGTYSNHLLVLRLEETTVGAVVAVLAAVLIFPVSTRRATRVAALGHLTALHDVLGAMVDRLSGRDGGASLTASSRALDHAHHQLLAVAGPLRHNPLRRRVRARNLMLFTEAAHLARNLVAYVGRDTSTVAASSTVLAALEAERETVASVRQVVADDHVRFPVRRLAQDLLDAIECPPSRDERRDFGRDLDDLDETLVELGTNVAASR
jgi:hypothetical protein